MTRHPNRRRLATLCGIAWLAITLFGCAGKVADPLAEEPTALEVPNPPTPVFAVPYDLVRAIASDWSARNWRRYADRLTDDYRFVFAAADSAGSVYRNATFGRSLEIEALRRMFETGGGGLPPMATVSLTLSGTLVAEPDPRPGKTLPWHQVVRSSIVFSGDTGDAVYRITGGAVFYIVRGDSARIPPELIARGFKPDSSQWWLERWEEETLEPGSDAARLGMPGPAATLGRLKTAYLSSPPGGPAAILRAR